MKILAYVIVMICWLFANSASAQVVELQWASNKPYIEFVLYKSDCVNQPIRAINIAGNKNYIAYEILVTDPNTVCFTMTGVDESGIETLHSNIVIVNHKRSNVPKPTGAIGTPIY